MMKNYLWAYARQYERTYNCKEGDFYSYCVTEATKRYINHKKYLVLLRTSQGRSFTEIARELCTTTQNVRTHFFHAVRDLREEFFREEDSLYGIGLSTRAITVLWRVNLRTISSAVAYIKAHNGNLSDIRGCGKGTEKEIIDKFKSLNLL